MFSGIYIQNFTDHILLCNTVYIFFVMTWKANNILKWSIAKAEINMTHRSQITAMDKIRQLKGYDLDTRTYEMIGVLGHDSAL